jgi:hypothetical protein
MPVGTQLAVSTDDGVAFDATVTWVYEQVGGADRVPGMVVRPRLASDPASAWWTSRVSLPDEDLIRVTRTRPVTARPRTPSKPAPVASEPDRVPAIVADLDARVTAGAGLPAAAVAASAPLDEPAVAPAAPSDEPAVAAAAPSDEPAVAAAAPSDEPAPPADEPAVAAAPPVTDASATVAMNPVDLAQLAQHSRESDPELPEAVMRRTGEHDVVDDGYETMIMASVDPAAIGLDGEVTDPGGRPVTDPGPGADPGADDAAATRELAADDVGAGDAPPGDLAATDDAAATRKLAASNDPDIAAEATDGAGGDDKPPRRGWFRRRIKRP